VLCEPTAASGLARLGDDGVEPGGAGHLAGAVEATGLSQLGEEVTGENRADAVDRLEGVAAGVGAGEAAKLGFQRLELLLEDGDQA
jgi:hypothetical protein